MTKQTSSTSPSNVNGYFLAGLLLTTGFVFFEMTRMFLAPVILAATFAVLFHPAYQRLLSLTKDRRGLCALACCIVLLTGLLIPAFFVANIVVQESLTLYKSAGNWTTSFLDRDNDNIFSFISETKIFDSLQLHQIDWQDTIKDSLKTIAGLVTSVIKGTSRGTLQFLAHLFVTFFTMFYFFRDGDIIMRALRNLSPLNEDHQKRLIERFASVSRATIKGTILIGLIQGGLGGLTLWTFGFDAPALWGVIMVMLSIIPLIGTWMVLYPAAIIAFLNGDIWSGVSIVLITAVIISSVDNFLRPYFVGRDTGMHDLLVFFSTIGGLSVFGVTGFIIGPVFASFFVAILEFYSSEN
ncbi:MAG: AI-2E family transporter [Candidatus Latescibacterota bacterium]|nr:AI-2E family transporter [Candidatus Latescibacterota bacterium]